MNKMIEQVREFHETFGHPVADELTMGDGKLRRLRYELVIEEVEELAAALDVDPTTCCDLCDDRGEARPVDVADALGDIAYVVIGAALAFGIDLEAVVSEIHRSNMSKLEDGNVVPHPTVPGKIGKGRHYTPPNLERVLGLAQGAGK